MTTKYGSQNSVGVIDDLKRTSMFSQMGAQGGFRQQMQPQFGFGQQMQQQPQQVDVIKVCSEQVPDDGTLRTLEPYVLELTVPAICTDQQLLVTCLSDKNVQALPQIGFFQLIHKAFQAIVFNYTITSNLSCKASRQPKSFHEYVGVATSGTILNSVTHFINEPSKTLGAVYSAFLKNLVWMESGTIWNGLIAAASITTGVYTRTHSDFKAILGMMPQHCYAVNSINLMFIEYVFAILGCILKVESGHIGTVANSTKGNDPDFAELSNILVRMATISLYSMSRGETAAKIAKGPTGAKDALTSVEETLRTTTNKLKAIKKTWGTDALLEALSFPVPVGVGVKDAKDLLPPALVKDQYSDFAELTWSQDTTLSQFGEVSYNVILLSVIRNYSVPEKLPQGSQPRFSSMLQQNQYGGHVSQYSAPRGQYDGFSMPQQQQYRQPLFGRQTFPTVKL